MTKKIFLSLAILSACLFFGSLSYAANTVMNGTNNAGNAVKSSVNKAEAGVANVMGGTANTVNHTNAATHNTAGTAGATRTNTGAAGMNNNMGTAGMHNTAGTTANNALRRNSTANNRYATARTATTVAGISTRTWTWFILGATALIVLGLVWYYMAGSNERRTIRDRH